MRESDGVGNRLLSICGSVAEMINQIKHILAILAALALSASMIGGFVSDHVYWAVGSAICLALVSTAAGSYSIISRMWRARGQRIAEAFIQLQSSYEEFESEVFNFRNEPSRESLRHLMTRHQALLFKICATAVAVFSTLKPRKGPFAANLKRIVLKADERGSAVPYYSPMASTYSDEEERKKYDEALKGNLVKVFDNFWYARMFSPQIGEDHFIHHDVRVLMRELSGDKFKEPNDTSATFFRSLMAFPVYGKLNRPAGWAGEPWYVYSDKDVAGLICIDSRKSGAFRNVKGLTREYDLNIIKQLTRCAFSSFRLVDSVADIAKSVEYPDASEGHAS